jgi:hypothetical protein
MCSPVKNSNNTTTDSHIFSQTQWCDFATLSAKGIDERRMKTEIVSNAIIKIYRDIVENYETDMSLKKMKYQHQYQCQQPQQESQQL